MSVSRTAKKDKGKPYDRPQPVTPARAANTGSGLFKFVSSLFFSKGAGQGAEPPVGSKPGQEENGKQATSNSEGWTSQDQTFGSEMQEARPPHRLPALQPYRQQHLPMSHSTPTLARLTSERPPESLGPASISRGAKLSTATRADATPSVVAPRSRGDVLLRDVDQMAIPTAFTPQFARVSSQRAPEQPQAHSIKPLPASRTMPSLTSLNGPGDHQRPSKPTSRAQLYLGPGYSAQNIARRRREANLLSRSQTLSNRSQSTSEPPFKRQRTFDAPFELPAVRAAIAQQPAFEFTFSAPVAVKASSISSSAPPHAYDHSSSGADFTKVVDDSAKFGSLAISAGVARPTSPSKPDTRSASLIRDIFNEEKTKGQQRNTSDLSNPYQKMDNPIARVATIKPRRSVRVPRDQIKKAAPPMTALERLEASAPADYRKGGPKRARTEADEEAKAKRNELSVSPPAASALTASRPARSANAPPLPTTSEHKRKEASPIPVATLSPAVPFKSVPLFRPEEREKSGSPLSDRSGSTLTTTKVPAPADVEMIDLDASDSEDAEVTEPSPPTESAGRSPATFSTPAPPKDTRKQQQQIGQKSVDARKRTLASNPFAALAPDDDEDIDHEKSTISVADAPALFSVEASMSLSHRPMKKMVKGDSFKDGGEFGNSSIPGALSTVKPSAAPLESVATSMNHRAEASGPASPNAFQTEEEKVRNLPASALPTFELLAGDIFAPRVADQEQEKRALALSEKMLPTFELLAQHLSL